MFLIVISLKTVKCLVWKSRMVEAQISLTLLHIISVICMKWGLKIKTGKYLHIYGGPLLPTLNFNHRRKFKPHLNFIKEMKIKLLLTFLIDIQNRIDLYFNLYLVFHLLCYLNFQFNYQVWFNKNTFVLKRKLKTKWQQWDIMAHCCHCVFRENMNINNIPFLSTCIGNYLYRHFIK